MPKKKRGMPFRVIEGMLLSHKTPKRLKDAWIKKLLEKKKLKIVT